MLPSNVRFREPGSAELTDPFNKAAEAAEGKAIATANSATAYENRKVRSDVSRFGTTRSSGAKSKAGGPVLDTEKKTKAIRKGDGSVAISCVACGAGFRYQSKRL